MTYKAFEARVSQYIDGELNAVQKADMDRKAAECPKCRALLSGVQTVADRLSQLPEVQPSAEFNFALRSHLLMELSDEQRPVRRVRRALFGSTLRTITTMAAAVVLGLGLAGLRPHDAPVSQIVVTDTEFHLLPSETITPNHLGALERLSQQSHRLDSRLYRDISDSISNMDTMRSYPPRKTPWLYDQHEAKPIPVSF